MLNPNMKRSQIRIRCSGTGKCSQRYEIDHFRQGNISAIQPSELHAEIRSEWPAELHAESFPSRRISKFTVQAYGVCNITFCIPLCLNRKFRNSCIIQSFNQSINQSIIQSINQSIHRSFNKSINQSIHQPNTYQSINQSINQSIDQSINESINQSIN